LNLFEALTKLLGTKRDRTIAYHLESNGLVERWHRSLKAAIMCQANAEWVDASPIVLIGLRTCYKENIRASAAELLYGKTLRIPGEFFDHENMSNDSQSFVELFRRFMQRMKPTPAAHHLCNRPFVFKDLYTYMHVFLRDDSTKRPLEQPYTGLHRVLERISERIFIVEVDGKRFNVSMSRSIKTSVFHCTARRVSDK